MLFIYSELISGPVLIIITSNMKLFFSTAFCRKKCLLTFDSAEMSWVRSVLGPKCLDTVICKTREFRRFTYI